VGWNGLFSDAFTVKVEVLVFGLFCIILVFWCFHGYRF
jgi:hypothetical protein